jgi:hypothetical protein
MAATNEDESWEEYTEEEIEAICQMEEFKREEKNESDVEIDVGEEGDEMGESEAESDPEDNIALALLQTTW